MTKPKLIIDTDPGHDDALAILLILLSAKFEVIAITTVAGNSTIGNVTKNAQAIINLIHADVPIFSGLPQPIKRKLVTAVVHGKSGLAGFDTSQTTVELTGNASQKIVELVNANQDVSILALGPLSNIARAFSIDSQLNKKLKKLVIMGGAIHVPGNKNRVAEFNFFVDPEAANTVFQTKVRKTLIPLDACNQVVLQLKDYRSIQNQLLRKTLFPMMEHFLAGLQQDDHTSGILVYDALAAYYLLNPQACTIQQMNVVIETTGTHTFGMSVAEKRAGKVELTNVDVVMQVNAQQFKKDFFEILSKKIRL